MAESPERFDLAEIVRETAGSLAPMAVEKDVELEVQAVGGATIEGNRPLVATLVRNLLDNAIAYARKGDRVGVLLDRSAAGVILRVIDTGPGMPPGARARAFERFYRGEGVREPGTGLGLSIVKRIAELHGAVVALDEAEGGGLEVTTRFPPVTPYHR
jgi:signal transduction histidine kinase